MTKPNPELRYDPPEFGGGLDELVAHGASVHLERMTDDAWVLHVSVPRGKPRVEVREGDGRRVLYQRGERIMLYIVKSRGRRWNVIANVIEQGPSRWRASRQRRRAK